MAMDSGQISPSHVLWGSFKGQLMDCKKKAVSFNDEFDKLMESVEFVDLEIRELTERLGQVWSKKIEYNIPLDQINLRPDLYIKCLEDIRQISRKITANLIHLCKLKISANETLMRIYDLEIELLNGMTMQEIENVTIPNFDWAKNNFHPSLFEIPEVAELRDRIIGMVEDDERKIKEFNYRMDIKRGFIKFCLWPVILLLMAVGAWNLDLF